VELIGEETFQQGVLDKLLSVFYQKCK